VGRISARGGDGVCHRAARCEDAERRAERELEEIGGQGAGNAEESGEKERRTEESELSFGSEESAAAKRTNLILRAGAGHREGEGLG